ncbi:hypothetical protein [Streptomyces sp. KS 21]|uniref:hypothetical protein n=1 Tax=Streptomyces sp. KS 21 TaxID=2485150 RepID=UPI0010F1166C|nr:hypothetical protein [Streptomyces sp. KS 21]TDU69006.1 hypothetical protein EDD91_7653 [Streptomyces sp. KS 21]
MIARDLAEPYPHVRTDDQAVDAVRLLAEHDLAALLVLESDGTPYAVVPGSQLVRQLVPEYVMEDPLLAAVIDDRHADSLTEDLAGKRPSLSGSRRAPSSRHSSAPRPGRCRSLRSWHVLTDRWSPSSTATARGAGWSAWSRPLL